jgi:hypothetical protein
VEAVGRWKHFVRLAALLGLAAGAFLSIRAMTVPKDFGTLGHFRASAITEAAAREPRHLGSKECEDCHDSIYVAWHDGKHSKPQCENCHGPGLLHVKTVSEDSTDAYPDPIKRFPNALRPTTGIQECKWCHLKTFERPATLKSINSVQRHVEKTGGTYSASSKCTDCHDPHTTVVK